MERGDDYPDGYPMDVEEVVEELRDRIANLEQKLATVTSERDAALAEAAVLRKHLASYGEHAADSGWFNLAAEIECDVATAPLAAAHMKRMRALEALYEAVNWEVGACERTRPSHPEFDFRSCATCPGVKTCSALQTLAALAATGKEADHE
jgi:hypothetical protein